MGELNLFVMLIALVATALTVIYSCRLALGLFGEESMRERYRGERDFDTEIAVRMGVLVLPSIIGGWFLRGLMGSSLLVYLRHPQKVFIMVMVLVLPSIIGGWFLRGLMGSSLLVYLRHPQKVFIMVMVLVSGLLILGATSVKFTSNTKLLNLLHQMWFIPLLFRVKLTSEGLFLAKDGVKSTDMG